MLGIVIVGVCFVLVGGLLFAASLIHSGQMESTLPEWLDFIGVILAFCFMILGTFLISAQPDPTCRDIKIKNKAYEACEK